MSNGTVTLTYFYERHASAAEALAQALQAGKFAVDEWGDVLLIRAMPYDSASATRALQKSLGKYFTALGFKKISHPCVEYYDEHDVDRWAYRYNMPSNPIDRNTFLPKALAQ